MNAAVRRTAIARFIKEHGEANIAALAERFSVSPMTIRRDRKILAEQNRLTSIHGGAASPQYLYGDIPYGNKESANLPQKRAIARAAARLVKDRSLVLLDSGTTTLELARMLVGRELSVITTDLQAALLLCREPRIQVYTTGGLVDPVSRGHVDAQAVRFLESVTPCVAFIGSNVWDAAKGVSCGSAAKQAVKQVMLRRASETVLLADSTKYGQCSPWAVGGLAEFSRIVTDAGLSENARDEIAAEGGRLTVAECESSPPQKRRMPA